MRSGVVTAAIVGVVCLGASSAGAGSLVFRDEASLLTAIGGTLLTVDDSNAAPLGVTPGSLTLRPVSYRTADGDVSVTYIPELLFEGRGITWNDAASTVNVFAVPWMNLSSL